MQAEEKIIRDFIYIDVDRVYSLYSQINEGVADRIVQSYIDESSSKHAHSKRESRSEDVSVEAQVAEMSHRTENKLLHDHIYNLFEAEIQNAILVPTEVSSENYREMLEKVFMIKVSGKAEIDDYNRIKALTERFNELVGGIAYAQMVTVLGMGAHQAEALVEHAQGKQKSELRKFVQKLKDPKRLAQDAGMFQDEQVLSLTRLFTEMFNPDGFEVTVTASRGSEGVVYRGALNRRWLRLQPDFLKALYGGYTEFDWTMVGQVTYLPGGTLPDIPQIAAPAVNQETNSQSNADEDGEGVDATLDSANQSPTNETPSMRDPFRTVFGALRGLERTFLESKQRVEVVVFPLAIYREMAIPTTSNKNPS